MEIIRLSDTTSTNDYLLQLSAESAGEKDKAGVCVVSSFQSAGKGMGTNTWESEAGKNLLFSILVRPTWLDASAQYLLSMAEAVALQEVLSEYSDDITIKWPNDIYWKDKKISGTRIDGNIKGRYMSDMVIGTGININQESFYSDAPNPVSLFNITGRCHDAEEILQRILERFEYYYNVASSEWLDNKQCKTISELYRKHLYRSNGMYKYEDKDGTFEAAIEDIQTNGMLILRRADDTLSQYEFKEVKFII